MCNIICFFLFGGCVFHVTVLVKVLNYYYTNNEKKNAIIFSPKTDFNNLRLAAIAKQHPCRKRVCY
jgi:hypothetical protein